MAALIFCTLSWKNEAIVLALAESSIGVLTGKPADGCKRSFIAFHFLLGLLEHSSIFLNCNL